MEFNEIIEVDEDYNEEKYKSLIDEVISNRSSKLNIIEAVKRFKTMDIKKPEYNLVNPYGSRHLTQNYDKPN